MSKPNKIVSQALADLYPKQCFEITAASETEATVKIYGTIGRYYENNARWLSNEIMTLGAKYERITFQFHSEGGEVFEGTAIFNAILNCPATTVGIVYGIAASMAGVLVMACDEVYMFKPTYLMIHSASGGAWGNAKKLKEVAELLEKVDKTLSEIFQEKTGKSAEEVAKWFEKDTWFTAQEALEAKLINGIMPNPKGYKMPKLPKAKAQLDPAALYNLFAQVLIPEQEEFDSEKNNPKNNSKPKNPSMKLTEEEIRAYGLEGVTAESEEAEIKAAIKAKNEKDQAEMTRLKNDLAAEKKEKVKTLLDSAQSSGRITAEQRADFEAIANSANFETVKNLIDKLPARAKITDIITTQAPGTPAPVAVDRANWTWNDYQEKDPVALEAMEENNPAEFKKLFNAEYGTKK